MHFQIIGLHGNFPAGPVNDPQFQPSQGDLLAVENAAAPRPGGPCADCLEGRPPCEHGQACPFPDEEAE